MMIWCVIVYIVCMYGLPIELFHEMFCFRFRVHRSSVRGSILYDNWFVWCFVSFRFVSLCINFLCSDDDERMTQRSSLILFIYVILYMMLFVYYLLIGLKWSEVNLLNLPQLYTLLYYHPSRSPPLPSPYRSSLYFSSRNSESRSIKSLI